MSLSSSTLSHQEDDWLIRLKVLCEVICLLSTRQSYWKSGSKELFLVAIAHPFFNKQALPHEMSPNHIELIFRVNQGALLGGKWGAFFIWVQTSPPCRDEELAPGWVGGSTSSMGFDKIVDRALCSKVGCCFMFAECRCERGYLVVIPPHFLGFPLIAFHSPSEHLTSECLQPSPVLEVTRWAMMWWRCTTQIILPCTLPV